MPGGGGRYVDCDERKRPLAFWRCWSSSDWTGSPERFPHELSGGEAQRVALARALAPQPAAVLLDEPFSNLDQNLRASLRLAMRNILKAADTAAVFVTHDREEALSLADRVAVMRDGEIEQIGAPDDIYYRPGPRFIGTFVGDANILARATSPRWGAA